MYKDKKVAIAAMACCTLAGAAFVGAGAGAAATHIKHSTAQRAGVPGHPGPGGPAGPGGPGGFGAGGGMPAIHSVSVQPNKEGTAFLTVTIDCGTIAEVDATAGTLSIKEGTRKATYQTAKLTIPSGATVTLDGKKSALEALKTGEQVTVSSSSEGTSVMAGSAPEMGKGGAPPSPPAAEGKEAAEGSGSTER